MSQVTELSELEKRLRALRKGQTLILDPRQARDLGYDINPEWNLKAIGEGEGLEPVYTFLTPERWEVFPEGGAVSPQGIRYTQEQIERMRTGIEPTEAGIEPAEIPVSPLVTPTVSDLLKRLFPEKFRPEASYGYTIEELPEMVWGQLTDLAQTDPVAFFNTIRNLGRTPDSESLLRIFVAGITAEEINRFFMISERGMFDDVIHAVFPDRGYEELQAKVEEDFGGFIDEIRTGGRNKQKQDLLRTMGFSWGMIGDVFSVQKLVLPVNGVKKLLTIDINRGTAYDETGAWVGTYNYVTQEFDQLPVESKLKDVWDAFYFGGKQLFQRSQEFVVSALPNFLFRDLTDFERGIYGDDWVDRVNAGNKQIRDEFRRVYSLSNNEWGDWIVKHPEYAPRLEWSEGVVKHPELIKDPMYWAYEFASTAPFMLAIMGTTIVVAAATGNPLLGITAGVAMATPPQAQEAHDALLAHGATEEQAGLMALPIGVLMSTIEVAGDLPYLKQVFPHIFKMFSKEITEQLAVRTLRNLVKKGLRTFSTIEIIEALEEVAQQAVLNAGIKVVDENQSIFEGLGEVFVRTLIATAPLAVFGAGYASLHRVTPTRMEGLTPAELEAKGLVQDPETGNWYESAKLPSEIEKQARIVKPPPVEAVPPPKARIRPPRIKPKPAPSVVSPPVPEAPMPKNAAGRVAQRIQVEPTEVGIADKIKRGYHTFQVKMVDDIYAIQKFRDEAVKGGIQLKIQDDPYIAGRLLRGVIGKANVFIEYGTLGKVIYQEVKGKAKISYTGESLESILHVVREPQKWRDFSTYLVGRRAVELHGRGIETGISLEDARDAVAQMAGENTYFPELADRLYQYQDRLMSYCNEMGLVSDELLEKLRETSHAYVPFYRVYNELAAKGFMGKKMANIAQPIKRIKGSEREIINPLESIVKNTYVLVSAAERNQVGIMMANLVDQNPELAEYFERVAIPMARVARVNASELGVEIEGLTDEESEQVVDIFRPSFYVRGDEVTVLIDGKKRYFKVDSDLRDALLNLDRESLGLIGKFLSYPAKWLRAGATLSPDFMVRNPARDQMTAFVYSNYNFLPAVDFLKGLAGVIRRDSDYQLYRASGAERAMLVSMDRQYLSKSFKEVVEGKKFTDYIKHPLELFQIVSEFGEKATRLGEFKKGIKAGAVPIRAGYSSRNVSLDFAQAGTTAFSINRLAAFFNANVRGWGRMVSSFKEHPARTAFKIFVGITLPSILLYYANRDDPRWKEIPQWQKDLFWLIFTEDAIYRIPKPFELGIIFGSIPERFLEWLDTKDPEMMKDVLLEILGQGAPNPMPTAILPVIESLTNYSFFMARKIVPDSRKNMPPELQYTGWTSAFSKKLGEWLNMSPAKFENVVRGWTGGLGAYSLDILGGILKGTGISSDIPEPSPTLADIPVVKAFVVRNPYGSSGETVNKFYELLEEYQKGESYLKEMHSLGEQGKFETYKAAHPELLFYYDFENDVFYSAAARYLRRVARDLSELRQKQDEIYKSRTMTPEEKRAKIDEIDILKTEVARRAMNLFLGEIPEVMEHRLSEAENRLGEVIEDVPVLSLELPDIYDMRKLNREYADTLEGVTATDLEGKAGIPASVFNWFEKETSESIYNTYPNTSIYKINADPEKGTTFEQYYLQWQELQRIIDPKEKAEFLKTYPKAFLGNLTKRQLELIRKYHRASEDEQEQMLKDIPDLRANPRLDWLRANPEDNARLALWGQAPILTLEAYTEFNRLVADLDIPNNAIPSLTLPPEKSIETHFLYEQLVAEGKSNSWEAQLLKAKDPDYSEWRGIEVPDVPTPSLELKTKHRNLYDAWDEAKDIEDLDKREAAIDKIMLTDVGGGLQFRDILRQVEAIEKGTNEKPTPDKIVNAWVGRGRVVDEFTAGSSEAKMWLVDNVDAYRWALEKELLTDDGGLPDNDVYILENGRSSVQWNIPVLTINRMWREQDTYYNETIPENHAHISNDDERTKAIAIERAAYLEEEVEYRLDRLRRRAYSAVGIEPDFLRFTPEQVELFVLYHELPAKGYRQERFLLQHPEFAKAMNTIEGVDIPKAENVPAVQYDEIYEQYQDLFDIWDAYGDHTSPDYIVDAVARADARDILFSGTLGKEFKEARMRRAAYKAFIGYEEQVDNFVQYYLIIDKGKPSGQDEWYDDDWFLMEHPQFYDTMLDLGIFKERRTFEKVPSREVWRLYQIYQFTPKGEPRYEMRVKYPELDAWLLLTGKVSKPVVRREGVEGVSPYEEEAGVAYQEWLEQLRKWEEYEERSDELDALLRDWRERMKK